MKMYEPGAVLDELDVAGRARRRTRRARRASSSSVPDAQHVVVVRRTSGCGPSTACASSSTSSASWRAGTARRSASTSATSPSIENTVSLTTIARPAPRACQQRVELRRGRVADRPRPRRALRRQPSMIDAWFSSSEQTSTSGPPNVVSTPRFAAKPVGKSAARVGALPAPRARLRARECTGREPTIEPGRARAGAPAVERGVRGRDHAGCVVRPR